MNLGLYLVSVNKKPTKPKVPQWLDQSRDDKPENYRNVRAICILNILGNISES